MSAPLPSPFLSPVFTPFSPSADSNHQEPDSEHHDSPHHHHHHHRKRERVKSFVKHLASPFSSPSPPPAHRDLPQETGSPTSSNISLSPELAYTPILRKRESGNSVKSIMKNPPSPHSTSSPLPTPFPSPDVSKLSPNPNRSTPEVDHHGSPTRKRERVKSFVNNLRRTSSQLFKKDKKDGDRKSALSALAAESLSISTAATTPTILRKFSHSKHRSVGSVTTTETEISEISGDVKVGLERGSIGEPIIEVPTPISPVVVHPVEVPIHQLDPTNVHAGAGPGTLPQPVGIVSQNPNPLQVPLPPSRSPTPVPVAEPITQIRTPTGEQEVNSTPGEDPAHHGGEPPRKNGVAHENGAPRNDVTSNGSAVAHIENGSLPAGLEGPSPHGQDQPLTVTVEPASANAVATTPDPTGSASTTPVLVGSTSTTPAAVEPVPTTPASVHPAPTTPAPADPVLTTPASADPVPTSPASANPILKNQSSLAHRLPSVHATGGIPVLIPPMIFWPISNMRFSYIFTPLLTWWLSKDIVNYPSLYS